MPPETHQLSFNGGLLGRGFWLYVWEIKTPGGPVLYYIGRTGDSSSSNAQSPFNRMGQHLGFNAKNNVLRRRLKNEGIAPEQCEFRLVAHGPILDEAGKDDETGEHGRRRDALAAMEMALAEALAAAGYHVMNKVHCKKPLDEYQFGIVRAAFATEFSALHAGTVAMGTLP